MPSISSKLAVLEAMEKKREAEATNIDRMGVKMELGVLDCPVCYEPLSPPILQVSMLNI